MNNIGVIGAGNMGSSLIVGLAQQNWSSIVVADPHQEKIIALQKQYPQVKMGDAQTAASQAILIVAIKPQIASEVLNTVGAITRQQKPLVISVMTGIRCAQLQQALGANTPIIRAMPNMPAQVHASMTAIWAENTVSATHKVMAEKILQALGETLFLENEAQMDAVTALSGSGPAYFFLLQEILEQCGVALGLPSAMVKTLVAQTAYGAAKMVLETQQSATHLREQVTAPNGTTAAALAVLAKASLPDLFQDALAAAKQRAIVLSGD